MTARSRKILGGKVRNGVGSHGLSHSPRQRPTLQTRNILDHLPERQRPWVQAILRRAYQNEDVKTATAATTEPAPATPNRCPGRRRMLQ